MAVLLDVNVLIALAWPNHVHHRLALDWFLARSPQGWATCPPTEAGFVRVSANKKVVSEARTPAEARQLLRRIVEHPGHVFWVDDVSFATSELVGDDKLLGYRQVTDAHLIAVAIRNSGSLATLDRGVVDLVPAGYDARELVELLL